jgi:DNA-binding response OmpR family regulator
MVYGDRADQTETQCCEKCGRPRLDRFHGVDILLLRATYKGQTVLFTQLQMALFRMLAYSFGEIVHKNRLHSALYAADPNGGASKTVLDVMVCKMRQKIKAAGIPLEIKTAWGTGYQLLALTV